MGEKWKTLSDKEKRPFFEMSKQSKLEHKKVSGLGILSRVFVTELEIHYYRIVGGV